MYWRGTFYMYVAGTRLGDGGQGVEALRRQGLARSERPEGPFVLDSEPLVPDVWSIDGHPFQDEDGTLWLFYNVRTDATLVGGLPGSGTVVDQLVEPDRLAGEPTEVAFPSERWEGSLTGDAYWNEGSWVLKRRGRYHQLYSGGYYRDGSYGIGITSADAPRGPWRKDPENPIFRSGTRITGPGHHSVILAPDGVTAYAVYHGYDGGTPGRKVHLDPAKWCGDRPVIGPGPVTGRPTEDPQPRPPGPVHDPAVPVWHADFFLLGRHIAVAGVELTLEPSTRHRRVRINQGERGLRIWVDGRLCAQARGTHAPTLETDGERAGYSLTSVLEDEAVYWLAPGTEQVWPWGGRGPLELTLAVRGTARICAGSETETLISPVERFALAHLYVTDGAEEIAVTGLDAGAHVTDLSVAAR
jgi:hypothetical protein